LRVGAYCGRCCAENNREVAHSHDFLPLSFILMPTTIP
jgi:hypothetical protein